MLVARSPIEQLFKTGDSVPRTEKRAKDDRWQQKSCPSRKTKEGALPRKAMGAGQPYFLYRKIASAIRTTVTIHKIVLLLLLFSSAMGSSTTQN